jgi:hypothetical protein
MAMEPNATRFPFPLPPRTIGEQKAKVKAFQMSVVGQFPISARLSGVGFLQPLDRVRRRDPDHCEV